MAKIDWKPTADGKLLKAMGENLVHRFASYRDEVQVFLISGALHAALHGDITIVSQIISKSGLGEGMQLNGMRAWLTKKEHGLPFGWKLKDKVTGEDAKFVYDADRAKALKAKYEADPDGTVLQLLGLAKWYKMVKEPEFEGFDLPKRMAALLKQAAKIKADEEKSKRADVDLTGFDSLKALVAGAPEATTLQ